MSNDPAKDAVSAQIPDQRYRHVKVAGTETIAFGSRRDLAAASVNLPAGEQIVGIDLGEGVSLFTGSQDLPAQLDGEIASRSTGSPLRLKSEASLERGGGDLMVHALRIMDVNIDDWLGPVKDMAADAIAREVARRIDHRPLEGRDGLGLWRTDERTPYASAGMSERSPEPALVMLHGFFSNARGSFGGLWEPAGAPTLEALRRRYGEAMLAFDHCTLGESPVRNALDLARALPEGQELHLLAYSRGGLVGELLSRIQAEVPFGDRELERYARGFPADADELRELVRTLRDKGVRVTRYVRVATPVRGTWLASNRLDRWLSIFWNVLRLAVPQGAQQVADFVFDLIATVIKKRLDRKLLPGIESMSPVGALAGLLNDAPPSLDQRLTIVGGDCVGHGVLHRLKVLVSDGFFGERHDLVVPTASMFGGAPRNEGIRYFFHQTQRVDHFKYFDNPESLQRISTGLIGDAADYARLQALDRIQPRPELIANRVPPRNDAPINVVLPGIMGSALELRGYGKLWVDLRDFALGRFAKLHLSQNQQEQPYPPQDSALVYPGGPLDSWPVNSYGDLMDEIGRRGEIVLPSGYDWRKPIWIAADALAARIRQQWPEGSARPLRLIAHSMGGLVARLMFARHADLKRRFEASPNNRLLMLGTPNRGSLAVVKALMGDNKLIGMIDCISLPQDRKQLLSVAASFPGFLELLPVQGLDWASEAVWTRLFEQRAIAPERRPSLDAAALASAARGRRMLEASMSALPLKNTIYIAGFVAESARDATIVELDAAGGYVLGPGDGTVPYASGVLDNVPTYYVNASHGDLPAYKAAFAGYFELLDRGETSKLATHYRDFRESRRGVLLDSSDPARGLDASQLPYRPAPAEIYRALMGMSPMPAERLEPEGTQPIKLRAVHGGLRFARHPIIVGHYLGDTMRGSEAELDRLYAGQLRRSADLGVYPGEIDSSQVFKREQKTPDKRSPYAVVVGLGRPGELTVGGLRRAVRRGILNWYGTAVIEALGDSAVAGGGTAFSLVLLGSSLSGMNVAECTRAILQGVQDAQELLIERRGSACAPALRVIGEIELIEIYQDKALELVSELEAIVATSEFRERFQLAEAEMELEWRADARRRLRDGANAVASIRRLEIRSLGGGRMSYSLPGIQAAVPIFGRSFDNAEIRAYACEVDVRRSTDPSLGRVLFHQLLPLDLKRFALEQYDLLLGLDQGAASIPWELADAGARTPLSVQSGMIRQLHSTCYVSRERVVQNTALVIGEPAVSGLPPLPGARREAAVVAEALRTAGFEVVHLDRPSALEVRDELGRRPYRIIHFAGHGVVDYVSPLSEEGGTPAVGMVIGSLLASESRRSEPSKTGAGAPSRPLANGDGAAQRGDSSERQAAAAQHLILLTPEDVRECVAQVPEVVFINCCHLGRQAGVALNAPLLASNLANSFMDIGCRAVVAAGWAVDDAAAQCFAEEFYGALVGRGLDYIRAVREARELTYRLHGERTSTWGAYQCYGDAHYAVARRDSALTPARFVSDSEYQCWLEDLPVAAMGAAPEALAAMRQALTARVKGGRWLAGEDVCMAAIAALENLGLYSLALKLVKDRIRARRSLPPALWRAHARLTLRDPGQSIQEGNAAMARLKDYATFENSAGVWFFYGTYCRRWFLRRKGQPQAQIEALQDVVYGTFRGLDSALENLREKTGKPARRPERDLFKDLSAEWAQKVLSAIIIADSLGKNLPDMNDISSYRRRNVAYAEMVAICEEKLRGRKEACEFWNDVDSTDLRLLLLASPKGSSSSDHEREAREIFANYQRAMDISATVSDRDSIMVYMRFWYEFAEFCAGHADAGHSVHWARLILALKQAGMADLGDAAGPVSGAIRNSTIRSPR
ncbi:MULTISPECIES: CHAT domain-containing protein [unclassified Lysobacter]|uniref:DUF7379 domain-containing protein n=1 Tax=unclassified Lysobacter TaxID=2635362 RepID=UPI001BE8D68D|nr:MULTISPECIES: CHAT domain-containing protein [unclassified Lysobacter]MBT2747300.1 CHAT domain-containing protein [Lysobacter sp. ISL-42]MBT2753345.1 CHAT domain-containing protein [Lysobacter sp. ISL-50]MBT2775455.1 CHAT domain-containing protein [Lysobacter sp. ISL-54]MBT2783009.1 CHAT domain-containing protein [Lysobacter sp. ISL-52]